MGRVVVFVATGCVLCAKVCAWLRRRNIPGFFVIDLMKHPDRREELSHLTQRSPAVPAVFFNEKFIGSLADLYRLSECEDVDALLLDVLEDDSPGDIMLPVDAWTECQGGPPEDALPFSPAQDEAEFVEPYARRLRHGAGAVQCKPKKDGRPAFKGKALIDALRGIESLTSVQANAIAVAMLKHGYMEEHDASTASRSGNVSLHQRRSYVWHLPLSDAINAYRPWHKGGAVVNALCTMAELQGMVHRMRILHFDDKGELNTHNVIQSRLFARFRERLLSLQCVVVEAMANDALKAFFLNLYHVLFFHQQCTLGTPSEPAQRKAFFLDSRLIVGSSTLSLIDIEHGILRCGRRQSSALAVHATGPASELRGSAGSSVLQPHVAALASPSTSANRPTLSFALTSFDPRVHFALTQSLDVSSGIQVWNADNVDSGLTWATQLYLRETVVVSTDHTVVTLPPVFKWYATDFGSSDAEVLAWIVEHADGDHPLARAVQQRGIDAVHVHYTDLNRILARTSSQPTLSKEGLKSHQVVGGGDGGDGRCGGGGGGGDSGVHGHGAAGSARALAGTVSNSISMLGPGAASPRDAREALEDAPAAVRARSGTTPDELLSGGADVMVPMATRSESLRHSVPTQPPADADAMKERSLQKVRDMLGLPRLNRSPSELRSMHAHARQSSPPQSSTAGQLGECVYKLRPDHLDVCRRATSVDLISSSELGLGTSVGEARVALTSPLLKTRAVPGAASSTAAGGGPVRMHQGAAEARIHVVHPSDADGTASRYELQVRKKETVWQLKCRLAPLCGMLPYEQQLYTSLDPLTGEMSENGRLLSWYFLVDGSELLLQTRPAVAAPTPRGRRGRTKPAAGYCFVQGRGASHAILGQPSSFRVHLGDETGNLLPMVAKMVHVSVAQQDLALGAHGFNSSMTVDPASMFSRGLSLEQRVTGDALTVCYTPVALAPFLIHVNVNDEPVPGSPFAGAVLDMDQSWAELRKVVFCSRWHHEVVDHVTSGTDLNIVWQELGMDALLHLAVSAEVKDAKRLLPLFEVHLAHVSNKLAFLRGLGVSGLRGLTRLCLLCGQSESFPHLQGFCAASLASLAQQLPLLEPESLATYGDLLVAGVIALLASPHVACKRPLSQLVYVVTNFRSLEGALLADGHAVFRNLLLMTPSGKDTALQSDPVVMRTTLKAILSLSNHGLFHVVTRGAVLPALVQMMHSVDLKLRRGSLKVLLRALHMQSKSVHGLRMWANSGIAYEVRRALARSFKDSEWERCAGTLVLTKKELGQRPPVAGKSRNLQSDMDADPHARCHAWIKPSLDVNKLRLSLSQDTTLLREPVLRDYDYLFQDRNREHVEETRMLLRVLKSMLSLVDAKKASDSVAMSWSSRLSTPAVVEPLFHLCQSATPDIIVRAWQCVLILLQWPAASKSVANSVRFLDHFQQLVGQFLHMCVNAGAWDFFGVPLRHLLDVTQNPVHGSVRRATCVAILQTLGGQSLRPRKKLTLALGHPFLHNYVSFVVDEVFDVRHLMMDRTAIEWGPRFASGAAGQLYRGKWQGEEVAVKVFSEDSLGYNPKEFRGELALMSVLRHRNLVHLLGASIEGELFLVAHYYPRGCVTTVLESSDEPLPIELVMSMALDAAKGMRFLHKLGIIHRDLKPGNLLVSQDWRVAVCDFGVSRMLNTMAMTRGVGTPLYMAPEVGDGTQYGFPADVYSFAMVMWELIHRHQPFQGENFMTLMEQVIHDRLRPPVPDHPLGQVIAQCWHHEASERPTFHQLVGLLRSIALDNCDTSFAPLAANVDPNSTKKRAPLAALASSKQRPNRPATGAPTMNRLRSSTAPCPSSGRPLQRALVAPVKEPKDHPVQESKVEATVVDAPPLEERATASPEASASAWRMPARSAPPLPKSASPRTVDALTVPGSVPSSHRAVSPRPTATMPPVLHVPMDANPPSGAAGGREKRASSMIKRDKKPSRSPRFRPVAKNPILVVSRRDKKGTSSRRSQGRKAATPLLTLPSSSDSGGSSPDQRPKSARSPRGRKLRWRRSKNRDVSASTNDIVVATKPEDTPQPKSFLRSMQDVPLHRAPQVDVDGRGYDGVGGGGGGGGGGDSDGNDDADSDMASDEEAAVETSSSSSEHDPDDGDGDTEGDVESQLTESSSDNSYALEQFHMRCPSGAVAIFGGSFDPPHLGHIRVAIALQELFSFDELVFVPARVNPFKQSKPPLFDARERIHMLQLMIQDIPYNFSVSDVEVNRDGPSYTVDTVRHMVAEEATREHPRPLALVLGEDSLESFGRWEGATEIAAAVHLVVVQRSEGRAQKPLVDACVVGSVFDWAPKLDYSSSEVRHRLLQGLYCGHLLSKPVWEFVSHRQYGEPSHEDGSKM